MRWAAFSLRFVAVLVTATAFSWASCAGPRISSGSRRSLRARGGQGGAMSELSFAAKLTRAGLSPWLEADVGGKKLDIGVDSDDGAVYMEVVAPDRSDMDKDAHDRVLRARERLGETDGFHSLATNATLLSPEGWSAAFERCFQPTRNRKLGATVACRGYSLDTERDRSRRSARRPRHYGTLPLLVAAAFRFNRSFSCCTYHSASRNSACASNRMPSLIVHATPPFFHCSSRGTRP